MTDTTREMTADAITVVPANEASWDDLQTVFGPRGEPAKCQCQCQCQWFKFRDMEFHPMPVEPRTAYPRLLRTRIPWTGRSEDKADDGVWSVTCFVTRRGFRHRGVAYALARATVDFARAHGAPPSRATR